MNSNIRQLLAHIRACDSPMLRQLHATYARIDSEACQHTATLIDLELRTRLEFDALCTLSNQVSDIASAQSTTVTGVLVRWRDAGIAIPREDQPLPSAAVQS